MSTKKNPKHKTRVWVDPSADRKGHWRKIEKNVEVSRSGVNERRNPLPAEAKLQKRIQIEEERQARAIGELIDRTVGIDLSVERSSRLSLPDMEKLYPEKQARDLLVSKINELYTGMPKISGRISNERHFSMSADGRRFGTTNEGKLFSVDSNAEDFPDPFLADRYRDPDEMILIKAGADREFRTNLQSPVVDLHNHPMSGSFSDADHTNPFTILGEWEGDDNKLKSLYSAKTDSYMVVDLYGNTYHARPTDAFRNLVLPKEERTPPTDIESYFDRLIGIRERSSSAIALVSAYYTDDIRHPIVHSLSKSPSGVENAPPPLKSLVSTLRYSNRHGDSLMQRAIESGGVVSPEALNITQVGVFIDNHLFNTYLQSIGLIEYTPTLTPTHRKIVREIYGLEELAKMKARARIVSPEKPLQLDSLERSPSERLGKITIDDRPAIFNPLPLTPPRDPDIFAKILQFDRPYRAGRKEISIGLVPGLLPINYIEGFDPEIH